MTTAPVLAVKAALYTALTSLHGSAAQVSYGMPGPVYTSDVVLVGTADVVVSVPVYHRHEHEIQIRVTYDCWRAGGAELQQTASEAALVMLQQLADYLAGSDRTLGGVCRHSFLSSYTLEETDDPDDAQDGRRGVVTATVTAYVRV